MVDFAAVSPAMAFLRRGGGGFYLGLKVARHQSL